MSSIMGQIEPEHLELFALEFGKTVESDFVYTLASANIDQSVPNFATMYMLIRSRMSLIMVPMEAEHPELFALEFGKIAESDCLHSSIYKYYSSIYKYYSISTKLGQNVIDHKISDEFDYGFNWTRTV